MATEFYDPAMGGPEGGGQQGITHQKVNLKSQPPPLPPPPMPRAPIYIFNLFVPPLLVFSLVYLLCSSTRYMLGRQLAERQGTSSRARCYGGRSREKETYFGENEQ